MSLASGDRLTAARLNRLQPTTYRINQTGGVMTLTTTETDVAGATVTITTAAPGATYTVVGVFDFECTTAGAGVAQGRLSVDGVVDTTIEAHHSAAAVSRDTDSATWKGTLTAAGSHTFKLRALRTGTTPAVLVANPFHTSALITITEVA